MSVTVSSYKNIIGGEWVDSASGETMEVLNPATGEPIAEVAAETGLDFGDLVAADTAPPPAEGLVAGPTVRRIETLADVTAPGW